MLSPKYNIIHISVQVEYYSKSVNDSLQTLHNISFVQMFTAATTNYIEV